MRFCKYLLLAVILLLVFQSEAQLSFPNGKTLNYVSHTDVMYQETEILFHTGTYHIDNYEWQKMGFDSLNPNWELQACMNGDCQINLPSKGDFIGNFGYNDTTGFIKFHVFTNGYEGAAKISYKVSNKSDSSDHALLQYYISYSKATALDEVHASAQLCVYPNPAAGRITIQCKDKCPETFSIYDYTGRLVEIAKRMSLSETTLDLSTYNNGIYFIRSENTRPYTFDVSR